MSRHFFVVLLVVVACQPKQPVAPSYFHAQPQPARTYASCQETVSCYTRCNPFTEQCMQTCDSTTTPNDATQARALTSCVSANRCNDAQCAQQQCSQQLSMCSNVRQVAEAPQQQYPQQYPQQPAPYPQQPAPYPQQPAPQPQQPHYVQGAPPQPQQPHYVQGAPPQPQASAQPTNAQPQNPYASGGTSSGLGAIAQAAIGGSAAGTSQASTAGALELVYQTPAGWKEDRSRTDSITLAFDQQVQAGTDFYGVKMYRLFVLPSQPIVGSISDTFVADWKAVLAAANMQLPVVVAPLKKRLQSGYVLALDGDQVNGVTINLYLVCGDQRCVPVLGMFSRSDSALEPMLSAFVESATLKGAVASKAPVYTKAELVGAWSSQSASLGNYVNSSGQYVGDASIATAETIDLKANGTYKDQFAAVKSGGGFQEKESGKWKVEDDVLVLEAKGRTTRYRIFARATTPQGKPGLLLPRALETLPNIELGFPRRMLSADWYTKVD